MGEEKETWGELAIKLTGARVLLLWAEDAKTTRSGRFGMAGEEPLAHPGGEGHTTRRPYIEGKNCHSAGRGMWKKEGNQKTVGRSAEPRIHRSPFPRSPSATPEESEVHRGNQARTKPQSQARKTRPKCVGENFRGGWGPPFQVGKAKEKKEKKKQHTAAKPNKTRCDKGRDQRQKPRGEKKRDGIIRPTPKKKKPREGQGVGCTKA